MRGSKKGTPPESFKAWLALENEDWKPSYDRNFQNPQKADLVDVLFEEQAGCCVYCGRALRRDEYRSKSHIDHFRPQAEGKYPHLQLSHDNLFVSCGPENDKGPSQTCGHIKGDWFDEDRHIDPKDYPTVRYFLFRSSGKIEDANSGAAKVMIETLNLNDSELVVDRRKLIDGVEESFLEEPRETVMGSWNARDDNGYERGLSYVVRRYFETA